MEDQQRQKQTITISADEHLKSVLVAAYNVSGQLVKKVFEGNLPKGKTNLLVDVSGFQAGLYIYEITGAGAQKMNLRTLKF